MIFRIRTMEENLNYVVFNAIMALSLILVSLDSSSSEIIEYHGHLIRPMQPEYLTIPKYSSKDAPHWAPGHGHSYIDFSHLSLKTECLDNNVKCDNTTFEFLMFEESEDQPWISYWPDNLFCCTADLVELGKCHEINNLILPHELTSAFDRKFSNIPNDRTYSVFVDGDVYHHDISRTGTYVLFMAICDEMAAPVHMLGSIDSVDPYGYLPADQFGSLPFYGTLSCLYSILGLIWLSACYFNSGELLQLQLWITAVLALGMLETTFLFAHFLNWNDNGKPVVALTMTALLLGVTKRAISRIVIQFVAMGYGVVRPSLGDDMKKVLLLGASYFVMSIIYSINITFGRTSKHLEGVGRVHLISVVVFFLAAIDTTFYIWIITSINNLLVSLAARKQVVKYVLYRNFRSILFVSLFFTCVWVLYGSVLAINKGYGANASWKYRWTVDALWESTYFAIFLCVAYMWAPSKNSQRYAYSVELANYDDSEELVDREKSDIHAQMKEELAAAGDIGMDAEYGGRLDDEEDPFQGQGALDPSSAMLKKN